MYNDACAAQGLFNSVYFCAIFSYSKKKYKDFNKTSDHFSFLQVVEIDLVYYIVFLPYVGQP